ncbi:carbonic anhydrase [Tenacibaculum amylolyticum]|uniref:carbonic anhydrase n=1 Tax=Tenacibaculum amylolyticum TaxID=104269 RepID=UPI0038953CFB
MKTKIILTAFVLAFTVACKNEKKSKEVEVEETVITDGEDTLVEETVTPVENNEKHEWSYEGENGTQNWHKTHQDCGGDHQSPIDIVTEEAEKADLGEPHPSYKEETMIHNVINNGHSVQFNFEPGDHHIFNDVRYNLKQIHFHEPSEHTINGVRYPMVIHLVHKSEDGQILVFAVMAKEGEGSAPFNFLESYLPIKKGETKKVGKNFNLPSILPKDKGYYYYVGSLTTPPCSEGVNWIVFKNPITVSKEQIEKMHQSLPDHNYRPAQPLNGRKVLMTE